MSKLRNSKRETDPLQSYLHSSPAVAQGTAGGGPGRAVAVISALACSTSIIIIIIIIIRTHLGCRPPQRPWTAAAPRSRTAGSRCSSPTCCSTGCTRLRRREVVNISSIIIWNSINSRASNDPSVFTITEKTPTGPISWFTSTFTLKTLLRHYETNVNPC